MMLDFVKKWEGCKLVAYQDGGGVWTIGYGTTWYPDGSKVKEGDVCTKEQADNWLTIKVNEIVFFIFSLVKVPLNENQLSALVSFTYNVGEAAFKNSTLLKLLNNGKYKEAADQFPRWNKDNGKVVNGLTNRRLDEQKLFLS
jgi:lysozyme